MKLKTYSIYQHCFSYSGFCASKWSPLRQKAGDSLEERDLPRLTAFLPRQEPGDSVSQGLIAFAYDTQIRSHWTKEVVLYRVPILMEKHTAFRYSLIINRPGNRVVNDTTESMHA
jgi:hypothetical protein